LENAGFTVEDRTRTGATDVVRKALESDEIDVYPEYTANGITVFHKDAKIDPAILKDARRTYETARSLDATEGIVWLEPAPANNTWAIAIPKKLADGNAIKTLEDFAMYIGEGGTIKVAGSQEFFDRADAMPAFEKAYGFKLTAAQKVVLATGDTAVTEKAAAEGAGGVNAAMAYGTDGTLAALDLVVLEDPMGVQPIYQPAPTIRKETLDAYPEIRGLLDPVFAKLDAATLQELNRQSALESKSPDAIALDWLRSQGFLD
jgi:osmoprotectant transport system substrate-binding protein